MLGDSLKRRLGTPEAPAPREPSAPIRPDGGSRWAAARAWLGAPTWWRWLVLAAVVLACSFGTGYLLATEVMFPPPETAGAGIAVPDIYGEVRAPAEAEIREAGLAVGEVREMRSMTTEAGRVLAQEPLPGQQLLPGGTVSLGVSAGPPELRVPPVVGLSDSTARSLLESVGFDVAFQQVRSTAFPAGVVTRADPPAGSPQRLPAEVTLVVSTGSPSDSLPGTARPGGLP